MRKESLNVAYKNIFISLKECAFNYLALKMYTNKQQNKSLKSYKIYVININWNISFNIDYL